MRRRRVLGVVILGAAVALLLGGAGPVTAGPLVNGDFGTGDLTGWTIFTTPNGTNGAGLPTVVQFDTLGTGTPVNSAEFQVGQVTFVPGSEQGGGLFQDVFLYPGGLTVSAAIAAHGVTGFNGEGGVFSILVDGTPIATHAFGFIGPGATLRFELTGSTFIPTEGSHEIEIEMTRRFLTNRTITPEQFFTDVTLAGSATIPEPSSLALLGLGGVALAGWRRWRRRAAV
jgi:hypothetical protein